MLATGTKNISISSELSAALAWLIKSHADKFVLNEVVVEVAVRNGL
jgi:hypothetical protein